MDATPGDLRRFIAGRADRETKRRVLDDLQKPDSHARKTLQGMELAVRARFIGTCPWLTDATGEADSDATTLPPEAEAFRGEGI